MLKIINFKLDFVDKFSKNSHSKAELKSLIKSQKNDFKRLSIYFDLLRITYQKGMVNSTLYY